MKLQFDPKPSSQYPHGYWYASTDDYESGEVAATPIDALSALVIAMEVDARVARADLKNAKACLADALKDKDV